MTEPPRRLPPAPDQRIKTVASTHASLNAQGQATAARPVRTASGNAQIYTPPPTFPVTQYIELDLGDGFGQAVMSVPLLKAESIADGFASVQTTCTLPTLVAAGGQVAVVGYSTPLPVTLWSVSLIVTNAACTERLVLASTAPIDITITHVALTVSLPVSSSVGSDLSLGTGGRVVSAAGGVFTSYLYAAVRAIDAS